ncbi:MAG: hypothetical protein U0790_27250 [Isosphaeraceae bacterium]
MANPKKDLRRINQNIPSRLYARLERAARREDRTKSAIVVRALEAYLGGRGDPRESFTVGDERRPPLTQPDGAEGDDR